jgi:hypothetical protein
MTAVVGVQDGEFALDGVAQGKTASVVKERDAIVERIRLLVLERRLPGGAPVGGPIDLRGFAKPTASARAWLRSNASMS